MPGREESYWLFTLRTPVQYNGKSTTEVPIDWYNDSGPSWIARTPEGSERSFAKDNVLNVVRREKS